MSNQGYDVVGDIHGHADPLHRLLHKLDYAEIDGVFRHPERKMIFVGDFIDRGPQQREVLRIARAMCEAGSASAVLGNHEFNAIGWATQSENGTFYEVTLRRMRTSTRNFSVRSKRTRPPTGMPSAGSRACRFGWTSLAFEWFTLVGTKLRAGS